MSNVSSSQGHPKGLYLLFFTEMWERFSYYGMRAIFILFMTKALFLDSKAASTIYGSYTGLVYLTPLLGGYISDRFWGNRRSILIGGILMAIGQFCMFLSGSMVGTGGSMTMMWGGLTFLIIGNGFFKPNISTMVGQLYPKNDSRIDAAFTIFYMGINLGALFAPLICGGLGEMNKDIHSFKWGFLAACIGMIVSTVSFEMLKKKYLISPTGEALGLPKGKMDKQSWAAVIGTVALIFFLLNFKTIFKTDFDVIGLLIYSAMIIVPSIIYFDKSLTSEERSRISVIFILAFFVIFFWACFEQAGASLTLFADKQTERHIGSWEMPASWFQSVNPLAIIALAPLFSMLWVKLGAKKMEPASPLKMAIGLILLAAGYVTIAYGVHGVDSATKISMFWLIGLYILHTMGELCLSPIGLSMVSKLAPARFASLLMGTWFLANAAANKLAGTLSALIPAGAGESAATTVPNFLGFPINNLFEFFMVFITLSGTSGIILFFLTKWLLSRMRGIR